MKAPGYNWLKYGAYILFAGGLVCSVFGWIAVLSASSSTVVLIYSLQAILTLFSGLDVLRSKNAPSRAKNCAIDAMCVIALNVIIMFQASLGFAWYMLPSLIGAAVVLVGAYLNSKAAKG